MQRNDWRRFHKWLWWKRWDWSEIRNWRGRESVQGSISHVYDGGWSLMHLDFSHSGGSERRNLDTGMISTK